jgi:lipopolysaccharide/colanic/teichoic acid biosynthesis glycosyltransferase
MYIAFFKRIVDVILALLAITVLLPLFIPVMIILLLTGEHEVFYLQNRVGHRNAPFKIWKFATMVKNSVNMGTGSLTVRNDPRVLPFGRFLRKTKINEFPQLVNVLLGTMSFVGARPQLKVDFDTFSPSVQASIYTTPPGITGVGSIIFRDEEKWISEAPGDKHVFYRDHIAPYKGAVEMWYQQHVSFTTDILLILITAWVIIAPESNLLYKVFKSLPPKPEIFN